MYKKIIMLVMLVLCFSMVGCSGLFQEKDEIDMPEDLGVLIWPETELTVMIPKPEAAKGKIEQLSNDVFAVFAGDVSASYFEKYVTDCISLGFNKNFSYNDNIFSGKNDAGYYLFMKYSDNIMYIKLVSPNVQNNGNNNDTNTGDQGNTNTEATYKLGMGIVVGIGYANNPADVQVDSTVAAVVLDANGVIVACRIDALQNIGTVDAGVITSKNTTSKAELGDAYGMSAAVNWGMDPNGDGVVKEWYEQAQAFEAYVTGKTVAQVEAMTTEANSIGYQWSTDATLLAAGCTIQIGEFRDAVVKACKDDQAATFKTSKEFTVGVAAKGTLDTHDQQFKNATADADGVATLFSEYAATVLVEGVIVAAINDAVQPRLTFDIAGTEGELTYTDTKRGLKEDYNMSPAINYGPAFDPNNDGEVKEWYLQSAAFSAHVLGMTAEQVANMATSENSLGYQMSTDADLLEAGCTIQITTIKAVVAASCDNAR